MTPAAEREHQRILAAYGGVYENARVQQMVELTVDAAGEGVGAAGAAIQGDHPQFAGDQRLRAAERPALS